VVVDSSSKTAVSAAGNAQVSAAAIDVVGGAQQTGTATFHPSPTTGIASVGDPLGGLSSPSTSCVTSYGSVKLSGNSQQTICPGIYTQITVSGGASLTMNPGIYIIEGGGFTVTGNASVAGSGVMIYNAGSNYPGTGGNFGGITLSGTGSFNLTAPNTGPYAGILIFQSRENTRALSFSGTAMSGMNGVIYAASALLSMSGNASLQNPLDVGMLNLSGNVSLTQTAAGTDGSGDAAGLPDTLLAGNITAYINDPSGLFTSDDLARIQDAINTWDALLVPYNVTITEVSDPTLANLVIDTGSTSACGSAANGVLGCYNAPNAEITILQGWSWYAGADPSQIGANQYDFETTVLHELGHALGLGHSANPVSPMYETLAAGVADRTVTTQDLNIPDPPAGADPQMAAGFRPGPVLGVPVHGAVLASAVIPAAVVPAPVVSAQCSVVSNPWPAAGGPTSTQPSAGTTLVVQGLGHDDGPGLSLTGPDSGRVLDTALADLVTDAGRSRGEDAKGSSGERDLPAAGHGQDGAAPAPMRSDGIDPIKFARSVGLSLHVRPVERGIIPRDWLSGAVLDEFTAEIGGRRDRAAVAHGSIARQEPPQESGRDLAKLAAALFVAGSWGYRARFRGVSRRQAERSRPE
jgi:hypothetical protein